MDGGSADVKPETAGGGRACAPIGIAAAANLPSNVKMRY
jgi:hypothetical protein